MCGKINNFVCREWMILPSVNISVILCLGFGKLSPGVDVVPRWMFDTVHAVNFDERSWCSWIIRKYLCVYMVWYTQLTFTLSITVLFPHIFLVLPYIVFFNVSISLCPSNLNVHVMLTWLKFLWIHKYFHGSVTCMAVLYLFIFLFQQL